MNPKPETLNLDISCSLSPRCFESFRDTEAQAFSGSALPQVESNSFKDGGLYVYGINARGPGQIFSVASGFAYPSPVSVPGAFPTSESVFLAHGNASLSLLVC